MRMRRPLMQVASVFFGCAFAVGPGATAMSQPSMPVHYGGDAETDACGALATVVGLDPKGDNFLSVRSGPGGKPYREVDRIRTGQRVWICEEQRAWRGVVYSRNGSDCGVGTPRTRPSAYWGPCRSGWVHRRYIRVVAG